MMAPLVADQIRSLLTDSSMKQWQFPEESLTLMEKLADKIESGEILP